MSEPITAEWLASVGFKWHQMGRQPAKHWLLWLGVAALEDRLFQGAEDIGIELAPASEGTWFCWFRSDAGGRYSRFIHLRYLRTQAEVQTLVAALTGHPWDPSNHLWGSVRTPAQAAAIRELDQRRDRQMLHEGRPWSETEMDDTQGGALPEHLEAHLQRGQRR